MSVYFKTNAHDHAIAIVTVALQSGSLKLVGPYNDEGNINTERAKQDAQYLNALINSIAANLTDRNT